MHRRRPIAPALVALLALVACSGGPTEPSAPVARVDIVSGVPAGDILLVGATAQFAAVARDAQGAVMARRLSWRSSDAAIATVSATGLVTAVSTGVVGITAEAGGQSGIVGIAVRVPVTVPAAAAPAPVTTSLLGDSLSLTVSPGAAPSALTIGRARIVTNDVRILTGTAFAIGPDGLTFDAPVHVERRLNLATIPAAKRAGLRLFRARPDASLEPVPSSVVDLVRGVIGASLTTTGTYVVVVPGDPAVLLDAEGTSRRVPVGTAVPGIGVVARDAAGNPVPGASIEFSVEGANGTIVGDTIALTGFDGRADLPGQWIAGPAKNTTYFLRARLIGAPLSVLFSSTVFTPAVAVRISGAPTEGLSGVRLDGAIPVELVGPDGDRAEVTQPVTLSLLGAGGTLAGTTEEMAVLGGAIFQGQTISGPGTYRFVVSSAGLSPDTSEPVVVTQQVAWMEVRTQPAGAASGVPFTTQPVVALLDHARLPMRTGGEAVIASLLGTGTLLGTRTVTTVDGIATFTDLAIEGTGTTQLNFSAAGPVNALSDAITVGPAPAGARILVGYELVRDVQPNQQFGAPIRVDLSNRGAVDLRTIDVTLTWDPTRFDYVNHAAGNWLDGAGGNSTVTVDDSQAAAGILRFTGSTPAGTVDSFILGQPVLRTLAVPTASTTIRATVNAATNAAGQSVSITVLPMTLSIWVP